MKEKIDDFSKGIFRYELPELILSTDRILLHIPKGESASGSFSVSNSRHERMEVFLFCDDREMELSCRSFREEQGEVSYCYHAEHLAAGQEREGAITLVSCFGEIQLPYEVVIEEEGFSTSIGPVSDLFQFTGLARENWEEARALFESPRFAGACLQGSIEEQLLYRGLRESASPDQAMEEFLRAVRKKTPVSIRAELREQEYHVGSRPMRASIRLYREGWGYLEVKARTNSPFLKLEKERLTREDFTAGVCELPFVLEPADTKSGKSMAEIEIITTDQKLRLEFPVFHTGSRRPGFFTGYQKKAYREKLLRSYIQYRLGRMTLEQYVAGSRALLYGLQIVAEDMLPELAEAYLNLLGGRRQEAQETLERIKKSGAPSGGRPGDFYHWLCRQLYPDEELQIPDTAQMRLLSAVRPEEKLKAGRELFQNGSRSPVLYLESWQAFREAPELLVHLDEYEIQVMNWSRKQGLWEEALFSRYVYLAENEKQGRRLVRCYLKGLYEFRQSREVLNALCTLLLRSGQTRAADAVWYQRGVEHGLKLTGLYEAYMDVFPWESEEEPDARIYTYFWKDNSLNVQKKAMLYAHIIRQKARKNTVYQNYQEQMQSYARERLEAGDVSLQLAVLYEDMLAKPDFRNEVYRLLPNVMFRCRITCGLPDMKGVCVLHAEEGREEFTAFDKGCAYVDIYTESVKLFLEDMDGRRYVVSRPYECKKLLRAGEWMNGCYQAGSRDRRLLLALSVRTTHYHTQEIDPGRRQRELLEIAGLEPHYRNEVMGELIQYYYDRLEGGALEGYLAEYDLASASEQERSRILNLMLSREMYVPAEKAMEQYGYTGIKPKYLQRLCNRRISETEGENPFLLELCWYLFRNGRTDPVLLEYLSGYYNGATINLYAVWEAARESGIQTGRLEERLLVQMLFSENILVQAGAVCRAYEKKVRQDKGGTGRKLLRAFLSYLAYRYLVSDRVVEEELYADMYREVFFDDTMLCKAAALKHFSRRLELTPEEREFAELQMERMARKGCILPFFQKFQGRCRVPAEVLNRSYAVYVTDPGEEVDICYRVVDGNHASAWQTERMPDVFYGIHIKEMLLFYGEKAQYYISVLQKDKSEITESNVLELDQNGEDAAIGIRGEEEEACQLLNLMLMAQELGDETTQIELMKQYIRQNYVKEKLFQPL